MSRNGILMRSRRCAGAVGDPNVTRHAGFGIGFVALWCALGSGFAPPQATAECAPSAGLSAGGASAGPAGSAPIGGKVTFADREIVLNAALQRELLLDSERLTHRKQELRWTFTIIALAAVIVVLLTWTLIANLRNRRELLRLADQDSLTGLPNRRRTAADAAAALHRAAAGHRPVTIALIDLDHFKSINDRCGHAAGDRVLKEFASITREMLRATDTLGRWGGEEFLLILPDTEVDRAVALIHRMRKATAQISLPETARDRRVSFSAGLASRTTHVQSLEEIVACADAALYEAKMAGRDALRLDGETYQAASAVLRLLTEGA